MAMAMAHVMTPPPRIRSLVEGLPPVTDGVFERVLAKDPADRYADAPSFARDLKDIASGRWYLVKLASSLGETTAPRRPAPESPPPPSQMGPDDSGTLPYAARDIEDTLREPWQPRRRRGSGEGTE
jgi:hypothetical protein